MNIGEMYGLMFTLLFNVGPLFQMYTIVCNRDSSNNSTVLWICGVLGQVCVLSYYNKLGVTGAFNYINSIVGLCLNAVMVLLIYVYRKQK